MRYSKKHHPLLWMMFFLFINAENYKEKLSGDGFFSGSENISYNGADQTAKGTI